METNSCYFASGRACFTSAQTQKWGKMNQSPVMWSDEPEVWSRISEVFLDHIPDAKRAEESRNSPCSAVYELYWLLLMLCASSAAWLLRARARVCVCVCGSIYLSMERSSSFSMRKSDFPSRWPRVWLPPLRNPIKRSLACLYRNIGYV